MRDSVATTALIFCLISLHAFAQTGDKRDDIWLASLRMFDAINGWAQTAEGMSGNYAKGAVASVAHTADGGIHWRDVRPADPSGKKVASELIQAQTADVALVYAGSYFRTFDGGRTWKTLTLRPPAVPWYGSLYFLNPNDGWFLAVSSLSSSQVDVYRSTDGGASWNRVGITEGPNSSTSNARFAFLDTQTGWLTGFLPDSGSPCAPAGPCIKGIPQFVTRDGGRTWQRQMLSLPTQFNSANGGIWAESPRFFSARDGMVVVGYNDYMMEVAGVVLYVTHDGGVSWTDTSPHIWSSKVPECRGWGPGFWSASPGDMGHVWVTDACRLHVTNDGGRTWRIVRPDQPFTEGMTKLSFISSQVGWATCDALCKPTLLRTADGGRTWTDLSFSVAR